MKTPFLSLVFALAVSLAAADADAARRFGGGGNIGKQRATPMQNTPRQDVAPAPAKPAQSQPAATPGTPAAKPSFMGRWGGLLAGLGIGALLASVFGAQLGPIIGMLLLFLLLGGAAFLLFRMFGPKRAGAAPLGKPLAFAGIGSAVDGGASPSPAAPQAVGAAPGNAIDIPGFEVEPFVRVAKTSFIRLQAANDAGDLDDIRDYTTPEVYAEIAMQVSERGGVVQKTEVVSLEAKVIEAVVEDGFEIASVRFWGLMREAPEASPVPFDEVWHVRKKAGDHRASWLIAGIQQG